MSAPTPCIYCGSTSSDIGHNSRDYREPDDTTGVCLSMDLVRNHCIYFGRMLTDPTYQRDRCPCYGHRKWQAECAREALARCVDRAREVWPAAHLAWLEPYVELALDPDAPAHHTVPDSRQEALL